MTHFTRIALTLLAALPPALAWAGCGDPAVAIHKVQGDGARSPLEGETVTVQGVMTRDARYAGGFGGFYLQQPDAKTDANPNTSEALFIYTRTHQGTPGQRLRVTGTVKEYHGLTELVEVRNITVCGAGPLPEAIEVNLPWQQPPESLENMRVRFTDPLTVTGLYNLAVYGEVTLAARDQVTATEFLQPGPSAMARHRDQSQQRVTLDDGRAERNPNPIPWPPQGLSYGHTLRAGDFVANLHGILDYRFGQWRLQPLQTPEFQRANPRPEAPPAPAPGATRVMALNLQNYFNGNGRGGGFPTARGAENPTQLRRQQARLTEAVHQASPHILAVSELENDGYDEHSAIAQLTNALGRHWRFIATPGQDGGDRIRTGLLYRSDRVTPVGEAQRLQSGPFANQGRPPLAQRFRRVEGEQTVRVVVPHLKSKSCRNAKAANTDQGDGQGCFNHRRTRETAAIIDWLASLPTPDGLAGTLIAGDLNSYARETPLQRFEAAGYQSLVHQFHPCAATDCNQHSYRFRGRKGSLDYLLATDGLRERAADARSWNINADEPRALGYAEATTGRGPWRSSDHNPVITDLRLDR